MADSVSNYAKGRVVEFYNRVKSNDPANSAIIVYALKASGLQTHAQLIDHATLAAVLGANTEATNTGYARKVLTDADLPALPAPDTGNDRYDVDLPDLTWATVQATGGAWGMLGTAYDSDTTGGTDSNIIPMTFHDFAVTPDGTDIIAQINGFFRAA